MKECPPDKILNPKTNRCVSKTGKVGMALVNVKPKQPTADLNRDVLNVIAKRANSSTKRQLKLVDKHFKETVKVSPTFGRKNGDFLLKYLKLDSNDEFNNLIEQSIISSLK